MTRREYKAIAKDISYKGYWLDVVIFTGEHGERIISYYITRHNSLRTGLPGVLIQWPVRFSSSNSVVNDLVWPDDQYLTRSNLVRQFKEAVKKIAS